MVCWRGGGVYLNIQTIQIYSNCRYIHIISDKFISLALNITMTIIFAMNAEIRNPNKMLYFWSAKKRYLNSAYQNFNHFNAIHVHIGAANSRNPLYQYCWFFIMPAAGARKLVGICDSSLCDNTQSTKLLASTFKLDINWMRHYKCEP